MRRRKFPGKHNSDSSSDDSSSDDYKCEVNESMSSCEKSTKKDPKYVAQIKKEILEIEKCRTNLKVSFDLNEKCQELLHADTIKCKNFLEKNKDLQIMLLENILKGKESAKNNCSKTPINFKSRSKFAAPYFCDVNQMFPPLNEDTIIKRKNHDVNAYLKPPKAWQRSENRKLLDGVTSYAMLSTLAPYKRSAKDLSDLRDELYGKIDWMKISSVNMEGARSAKECEYMWKNALDFSINKHAFSKDEDEKLRELAEEFKGRNWDAIAKALKTNRSAIQCFERYQRHMKSNLKKSCWTSEEDQHLNELVKKHKTGKFIPWNKISLSMKGRTTRQIISRYQRKFLGTGGPWTLEETALLYGCVQKFGSLWSKMKPFFKRRNKDSLRERYNAMDPNLKYGAWTKEEDMMLISLIRKYGYGKWIKICQHIPGRNDNMCMVRAKTLKKNSQLFHASKHGGENEIDVNDPESFVDEILKPIAPTKSGILRATKMKTERKEAVQLFYDVMKKLVPRLAFVEDVETFDFSSISNEIYHQLSNELYRILEEKAKFPQCRRKKECESYENPEDTKVLDKYRSTDELHQVSPVKSISESEKLWLCKVMSNKFEMALKIMRTSRRKFYPTFCAREHAEMSSYKGYLYKQYKCSDTCDEEDDISNVTLNNTNYDETLQNVIPFFIHPPVYNDEFIVLSPNMTTLGAMEVMEATEAQLKSMSELVRYSDPYMDFLYERDRKCPKCLQCLHREGAEISTKVAPAIMLSDMKIKYFIVDETLEKAAHVECASVEKSNMYCSCAELERSHDAVRLLRKRFMSLFMWPALLSSTKMSEIQESLICSVQESEESAQTCFMSDQNCKSPRRRRYKRLMGSKSKCKKTKKENSTAIVSEPQKPVKQPRPRCKRNKGKDSTAVIPKDPTLLSASIKLQIPNPSSCVSGDVPDPTNSVCPASLAVNSSSSESNKLSNSANVDSDIVSSCSNDASVKKPQKPRPRCKRNKEKNSTVVIPEDPAMLSASMKLQIPDLVFREIQILIPNLVLRSSSCISSEVPDPTDSICPDSLTVSSSRNEPNKLSNSANLDSDIVSSCSNDASVKKKVPKRKHWSSVEGDEIRRSKRTHVPNRYFIS